MAFGDPDASTPAFVKANAVTRDATTASFTPPVGAVLCAWAWHDTAGGNLTNTSQVTDSQGLTWTRWYTVSKQDDGVGAANAHIAFSTAAVASSVSMTVTTTGTNTGNGAGLRLRVVTGADTTTPVDVTPVEGTINNAVVSANITAATTGGRAVLQVIDWNFAAAMTAGANVTADIIDTIGAPDDRIFLGVHNSLTTSGVAQTLSTGSPSSGNTNNYGIVVLRPASVAPSLVTPQPLVAPSPAVFRATW